MNKCYLCPRKCGANRNLTSGFCGAKKLKISKVMVHEWEEPVISGTKGSGAIFFTHCPLKCDFCQNYEISHLGNGKEITVYELAEIFKELESKDVHNINLVSGTQFVNEIIDAFKIYKPQIPVVWNSSGYENLETIEKLKPYIDIYLPDLKYFSNELSEKYSKTNSYFNIASQAILQMRKNAPEDVIENGIMKKGLIVRHLILPSHYDDSKKIFNWINNNLGNTTYISVMSQYIPCFKANYSPINRKITALEYKIVLKEIEKLNFVNGFYQELESASTDFIPNFKIDYWQEK